MCTVSMVAQDWHDRFYPRVQPYFVPNQPGTGQNISDLQNGLTQLLKPKPEIPREEFDALKAEVESLKKLLLAAKQYDKETGQPDCEDADKIALFKQLAKALGVDLSDVFAGAKP